MSQKGVDTHFHLFNVTRLTYMVTDGQTKEKYLYLIRQIKNGAEIHTLILFYYSIDIRC